MSGVILGFDFGVKKIGIAVGQQVTRTANPLTIIRARDGIPDWDALDNIMNEWRPTQLVVGLPLNMDDTPSDMSALAEKFGRRLNGRYNLPVEMMDERLSTFEAQQRAEGEETVDAIAATVILESWLTR